MEAKVEDSAELIEKFVNITSTNADIAKQYLNNVGWDIEDALSLYFRNIESEQETSESGQQAERSNVEPSSSVSKFATLSSLTKPNHDSSSDEEGQAFYAGGSERSGQQVLGPGKKKSGDIVSEMFKAAKEHGAEVVGPSSGPTKAKLVPFKGTGYRLGATEDITEVIPSASAAPERRSKEVTLKLWKNGFSVDDGPLRLYDDPENKTFLESVRRGEIPSQLHQSYPSAELNLNMEDHRREEFVLPRQNLKMFSGQGHMLGSPAPTVLATDGSSLATPDAQRANEETALQSLGVNLSLPLTTVQIRLADGSRIIAKLNYTNTVGDLRRYIILARPEYEATVFTLMTTFPNKELTEDKMSLEEAKLLNAVIVQRLL